MVISYNKLWKLLIDRKMSKADLRRAAGIAPNTMTKLNRDEEVTLETLGKICGVLGVNIGDVVDIFPKCQEEKKGRKTIFEIIMTILNLIAVLLIPVVAVFVGQYLQERAQRRKDKMDIFKTLMINRVGWSVESTRAMNIIDIVFSDDKNVRQAWSEYYHALCVKDPDEIQLKQMQQAQDKLLEKMAISLGYKDKITWETIQNPYVPKGMMEAMDQQQIIQKGQTELAKVAGAFAQMINTNAANQAPNRQEDNSHANT